VSTQDDNNTDPYAAQLFHEMAVAQEQSGNIAQAASLYQQAAERGLATAQCNLGYLYFRGHPGLEQDLDKAMFWFYQSASQGYAHALFRLGVCYEHQYMALSQHHDDIPALESNLPTCILSFPENTNGGVAGAGTIPNILKAIRCYELATERGHVSASVALAYFLLIGCEGFIQINFQKAFDLMASAAQLGNTDAMVGLGYFALTGLSTMPQNFVMAGSYFVDSSNRALNADALFFGAFSLECGLEQQQLHCANSQQPVIPPSTIMECYRQATDLRHPAAQNNFALCCLHNIHGPVSVSKQDICQFLVFSAEQNLIESMYNAGYCYERGIGVEIDTKVALSYYMKVIELGPNVYHNFTGTCWIMDDRYERGYQRCMSSKDCFARSAFRAAFLLEKSSYPNKVELSAKYIAMARELETT
jgi:uncharacterized protein